MVVEVGGAAGLNRYMRFSNMPVVILGERAIVYPVYGSEVSTVLALELAREG